VGDEYLEILGGILLLGCRAEQASAQAGDPRERVQPRVRHAARPAASPQPAIETHLSDGGGRKAVPNDPYIKGFNFARRLQVIFDGKSVPFKAVSPTELQVTLDETPSGGPEDLISFVKIRPRLSNRMGQRHVQHGASID